MRLGWRALPALALVAAAFLPAPTASAGDECLYYKWNAATRRWEWQGVWDETVYEAGRTKGVDWHCKYCYVQAITRDPDLPPFLSVLPETIAWASAPVSPVVRAVDDAVAQVHTAIDGASGLDTAQPFDGPECPDAPPAWDAVVAHSGG